MNNLKYPLLCLSSIAVSIYFKYGNIKLTIIVYLNIYY